jgi:carbonic anhydrase
MFESTHRQDRERLPPGDAEAARRRLEEGNRAFASLAAGDASRSRTAHTDSAGADAEPSEPPEGSGVPIQQPFAAVLGCSDARVPVEMIFDRASNELFVVRVAGNVIGQEILGSIDYAVEHLGESLKLIVALGHSRCGAVTAAVDAYLQPAEYLGLSTSHHLRSIVNILFPAVRGAVRALSVGRGEDVSKLRGYRAALIECSVIINAALTASILRSEFGDEARGVSAVFGVYDLASRRVHVPVAPVEEDETDARLLEAPKGRDEFRQFASRLATSAFIERLLMQ